MQPRHRVVLCLRVERRVQEFARAAAQGAQDRIRVVPNMQSDHMRPQVERGNAANQLAGLIEVRARSSKITSGLV